MHECFIYCKSLDGGNDIVLPARLFNKNQYQSICFEWHFISSYMSQSIERIYLYIYIQIGMKSYSDSKCSTCNDKYSFRQFMEFEIIRIVTCIHIECNNDRDPSKFTWHNKEFIGFEYSCNKDKINMVIRKY